MIRALHNNIIKRGNKCLKKEHHDR